MCPILFGRPGNAFVRVEGGGTLIRAGGHGEAHLGEKKRNDPTKRTEQRRHYGFVYSFGDKRF